MEKRKCSIHNELLAYYCAEDAACICASCHVAEEHRGHKMETLAEASEKKQQELRNVLQRLTLKREEIELKAESSRNGKTDAEKVALLFGDLWKHLEYIEKRSLQEVSSREEQAAPSVSSLIRQLTVKKDELSRKVGQLEELCNMANPLTVLQDSDAGDFCDTKEGDVEFRGSLEKQILDNETDRHDYLRINEALRGLSAAIGGINLDFYRSLRTNWTVDLDERTAANNLQLSENLNSASWAELKRNLPETPERFREYPQVLSVGSCSSGRHYWIVTLGKTWDWGVGMCYPSMDRAGEESLIGNNTKSWCVRKVHSEFSAKHGGESDILPNFDSNRKTMRMYLNYEAGQITFYEEGDWFIEHIHSFTACFSEPLHVVLYAGSGTVGIKSGVTVGSEE